MIRPLRSLASDGPASFAVDRIKMVDGMASILLCIIAATQLYGRACGGQSTALE